MPSHHPPFELPKPYLQLRYDIEPTVIYIGYTLRGVATSDPRWTIRRITFDVNGNPDSSMWSANNVAWDDRATTVVYS